VPEIRSATHADVAAVGATLAAAFDGDPVMSWMASPKVDWSSRATAWFTAAANLKLGGQSEVLVDDQVRGAALWSPPQAWKSTVGENVRLAVPSLRLFGSRLPRAIRAQSLMEKLHPTEPHWYLAVIGTDPAHQGSGVGSALISTITDRCDREGLGAYLESSKEANVSYYARHGFEVSKRVELHDGPPLWLMWRDPRSS
jgi:ribosomal protein S18 acetylase RimI-like enzyme